MDINEKIKEAEQESSRLKRAKELYPNVNIGKDRWGTERLFSSSVNDKVDKVNIHHSCGCCPDAGLLARPYLIVDGITIYSDPSSFYIGQQNEWGLGEIECELWEEDLRKKNITEEVIQQIRKYLDDNPPVDCDDDDSD